MNKGTRICVKLSRKCEQSLLIEVSTSGYLYGSFTNTGGVLYEVHTKHPFFKDNYFVAFFAKNYKILSLIEQFVRQLT